MIFFDIDTQHDFLDESGALYMTEAESIKPNLERLLRAAGQREITTISSRCAHQPGDPEFEIFPPHCVEGTRGAEGVFTDLPALPHHHIAVDAEADPNARLERGEHYIVKKKVFDLFSNAWLDDLRQRGVFNGETCVVFGVATDYCVRACVLGLAAAGAKVLLVEDAIRGVAEDTTNQAIGEIRAVGAGVKFTTTDEVLKGLTGQSAAV